MPASATTPNVGPNGQGTLLVIGDSLTVGTTWFGSLQSKLESLAIWQTVTVDAKVGRLTTEGAVVLSKKFTNSTTAIAIALGTNDMISRRDPLYPPIAIDRVMAKTHGVPTLWFNTKFSPTGRGDWRARSRRFNRALRDAQVRWPNLIIADWYNGFTPSGKSRYIADGVHLSVSGYKTRTTFMVKELKTFGNKIVLSSSTTSTSLPMTTSTTNPSDTSTSTNAPTTTNATSTTVPNITTTT